VGATWRGVGRHSPPPLASAIHGVAAAKGTGPLHILRAAVRANGYGSEPVHGISITIRASTRSVLRRRRSATRPLSSGMGEIELPSSRHFVSLRRALELDVQYSVRCVGIADHRVDVVLCHGEPKRAPSRTREFCSTRRAFHVRTASSSSRRHVIRCLIGSQLRKGAVACRELSADWSIHAHGGVRFR
jgi:hypothetical protein